jgi:hypothetical protein
MAEVLVKFTEPIRAGDKLYWVQACGRSTREGGWEGWIEFQADDGKKLRSGRETSQPNRVDTLYWAEGLTATYLEGALDRALRLELGPRVVGVETSRKPLFEGPAFDRSVVLGPPTAEPNAILDPFAVYLEGEGILRRQLGAMSRDQVRNIALAYRLLDGSAGSVAEDGSSTELAEHIVRAVRRSFHRTTTEARPEDRP